jgi:SPP1 family predicted phage head-tail adaptor
VIGTLDLRATLLAQTRSPDGGGGFGEDWQSFAAVWASLEAQGGGEETAADANETRARYRVAIRRRTDVSAGQRVAIGARRFRVLAVMDEGPHAAAITLLTEEIP